MYICTVVCVCSEYPEVAIALALILWQVSYDLFNEFLYLVV